MDDRFVNRLTMFTRCLDLLNEADNVAVWQGQPPLMFTTKAGEAQTMVGALQDAQQDQETGVSGATTEKKREETELEDMAYAIAQACVMYYNDHEQETEAGMLDLTLTQWRTLRDQSLLAKAQLLIEMATALSTGATAAAAAPYGITPTAVLALTEEREDYDDIINAPEVAIAVRKALTHGFQAAFNLVEKKFVDLDKLILQFRTTAPGREMVAEWQAGRNIKGPGQGSGNGGTPPPPPPEPPVAPQNVVLVQGAADSGEMGLNADASPGADLYKLLVDGSVVATSATLPVMATFTPAEEKAMTLVASNAGGDSPPSDTITGTAP